MKKPDSVLVLTVGTGNVDELESSLITPLKKSMTDGDWGRIVLLPSQVSSEFAERLRHEGPEGDIQVLPLAAPGDEYDPDTCFVHFDRVLSALTAQGIPAERITADFTRGTKVMSAALVLAATRHGVPRLRYITGDLRDSRHMVVAGTERIRDGSTTQVTARRQLDAARSLMEHGNFAAVLDILPDPDTPFGALVPPSLHPELRGARRLAAFFGAWDRLDFVTASGLAEAAAAAVLPAGWGHLAVSKSAVAWVRQLASDTEQEDTLRHDNRANMGLHVGHLAAELIANAHRRLAHQQYEDANIRAYRCLELLGQARLFERNYDSEFMPADDDPVRTFVEKMRKAGSHDIRPADKAGTAYSFPREKVARFLKSIGETIGKKFQDEGNSSDVKARNKSILIHGFRTTGPREAQPLQETLTRLEDLLEQAFPDQATDWLAVAGSIPPPRSHRPTP